MMKNKKLFYVISILVVIIRIGLFGTTPTSAQEVTIIIDKTEYDLGDVVKVELSFEGTIYEWGEYGWSIQKWEDNSWKNIFVKRGCHSYPDCKSVDFKEIKECLGYSLCERPIWYKVVKEGESSWRAKWMWDQTKGIENSYKCKEVRYEWSGGKRIPVYSGIAEEKCMAFEQVPPGKYKVRFEYALAINPNDPFNRNIDIKYAEKEFMIQERTGISIPKNCNDYEMPMKEEEIKECACPEGYKKFNRLMGAYCATDSQKPCNVHIDCPRNEHCISGDGKNWFCTGQFAGCYYNDPKNLENQICVD